MATGKITALRKESDVRFIGQVKDDISGEVLDFDYATNNPAQALKVGQAIEFSKEMGQQKAIRIRIVGYNYG